MLDKIRIQNVRSLKDTDKIKLSPITLLVGENSSGKSTFLRMFPLLKQSICKRTNGPVLWAGDVDDYVDFGSFQETVTNDGSHDIKLSFYFLADVLRRKNDSMGFWDWQEAFSNVRKNFSAEDDICYSITISPVAQREQVTMVEIKLNRSKFQFHLSGETGKNQILVDNGAVITGGKKRKVERRRYRRGGGHSGLFEYNLPSIDGIKEELLQTFLGKTAYKEVRSAQEDEEHYYAWDYRYNQVHSLIRAVGQCFCAGVPWTKIKDTVSRKALDSDGQAEWDRFVKTIDGMDSEGKKQLRAKIKLVYFYDAFVYIERYLDQYFRQVHYIAPLRATAERYYRLRNLAIDEVDYQGKNLPIFLNSLSSAQTRAFKDWTQEHFGFQVNVVRDGGHISLSVSLEGANTSVNISDTGFGYSQILPIITQLWDLSVRPMWGGKDTAPLVIAIEQPELHLHPALQVKLTNAFMACIKSAEKSGQQLQLLIETHSETIINSFGRAIARGQISNGDVSVALFQKKRSNQTKVIISEFDTDGYLKDWPVGFFAPKE